MPRKKRKLFFDNVANWERVVASTIRVAQPEDVRKIADVCLVNDCCAYHGAAIFYGHLDRCPCAPCVKARARTRS